MNAYEKYQLQWMIEHDHSLEEIIDEMKQEAEDASDYYKDLEPAEIVDETYDTLINKIGFDGGEMFANELEFNDIEGYEARIDKIHQFATNRDDKALAEKKAKNQEFTDLTNQILSPQLSHRIKTLINVGRACRENKVSLSPNSPWDDKETYNENNFYSYDNKLGFTNMINEKDLNNLCIGIDFYPTQYNDIRAYLNTDGEILDFQCTRRYIANDLTVDEKLSVMQMILDQFDEFESKFYEYIDNLEA